MPAVTLVHKESDLLQAFGVKEVRIHPDYSHGYWSQAVMVDGCVINFTTESGEICGQRFDWLQAAIKYLRMDVAKAIQFQWNENSNAFSLDVIVPSGVSTARFVGGSGTTPEEAVKCWCANYLDFLKNKKPE